MYRETDRNNGSDTMSAAIALRDELPRILATQAPAKVLSFKAQVSKRTIEGIKRQEHVISAAALIELARQYPQIKTFVLELMGPVESDPAWLMAQLQKHLGKR